MKLPVPLTILLSALVLTACGGDSVNSAREVAPAAAPALLSSVSTGGGARVAGVTTFAGKRANYTVVVNGTSVTVTDNVGTEGRVTLTSPTRLVFADGGIAFDLGGTAGKAYRLYQAAFNRTPDLAGLGYWIEQMDKGQTMDAVSAQFIASAEFIAMYGAKPSNRDVISKFYQNVLHRKPDQAGYDYWVTVLDTNAASVASVLAFFGESPENQAQVAGAIAGGINFTLFKVAPPTQPVIPGVLNIAGLSSCKDASYGPSMEFYKCMTGTAVGTTRFGTDQCTINISSNGFIVLTTKTVTRMVNIPYYDAFYSKSSGATADAFAIIVGVSDIKYIGTYAMSGHQGSLQIISPKHASAKLMGAGILASLDDLHCHFHLQ